MTDLAEKKKRSKIMARVSRKDTPFELLVRKYLFAKGFRYRTNYKALPGSPDIVLPKYRVVIFINGCFWHGHPCKAGRLPKSNLEFWQTKIAANRERDSRKNRELRKAGWRVLVLWECRLKNAHSYAAEMDKVINYIENYSNESHLATN